MDKDNIKVEGHRGSWHVIDEKEIKGKIYFLLEHNHYGEDAASVIIDENGKVVAEDVRNGFNDLEI